MSTYTEDNRKVTTRRLLEMKQRGEKISMLTAYDYSMASIIDQAGMDVILVGDSASNVMVGNITTLPMTLDQMIYHGQSVVNGVKRALVVVDMPFDIIVGTRFVEFVILNQWRPHGAGFAGNPDIRVQFCDFDFIRTGPDCSLCTQ